MVKMGTRILNDAYNASPTAMRAVIDLLENMDGSREKIVVLGDMLELGSKEKEYHEQIGEELNSDKIKLCFYIRAVRTIYSKRSAEELS